MVLTYSRRTVALLSWLDKKTNRKKSTKRHMNRVDLNTSRSVKKSHSCIFLPLLNGKKLWDYGCRKRTTVLSF